MGGGGNETQGWITNLSCDRDEAPTGVETSSGKRCKKRAKPSGKRKNLGAMVFPQFLIRRKKKKGTKGKGTGRTQANNTHLTEEQHSRDPGKRKI